MRRRGRDGGKRRFRVLAGIASLTALLTASLTGCASGAARTTGPFASVGRITTELRRGVSTKADVERVLGKPNGNGTSLLPTQASPRDVWIYNDVQTGEAKQEGKVGGVPLVRVDMRQQIIFVFFDGDRFDGYLWSTHVGAATAGSR